MHNRLPVLLVRTLLLTCTIVIACLPQSASVASNTSNLAPDAFALYDSGRIEGLIRALDAEDSLLVIAGLHSFTIYDVSDPTRPRALSTVALPDMSSVVQIEDEFLYIAWGNCDTGCSGGFDIYDLALPTAPMRTARLPIQDRLWYQLRVVGTTGYVTDNSGESKKIDLRNPSLPIIQPITISQGYSGGIKAVVERPDLDGRIFGYATRR
ncbi:MAG: hypothetical protein HGA19_24255, partial [Oscillochloris sp.]|nr:hypothetical protein [Oscillochloris sp.]